MAKMDDTVLQLMQMSDSHHKSTEAALRRMEMQLGHILQKLDYFGGNMEVNPSEECQAIITRSDKVLDERKIERKEERQLLLRDAKRIQITASTDGWCYDE
ncbi:hypothetical protein LR48_Vigan04g101100 [Vigna angularis]|uniref:Uncharacterized protein n=1 Tax=Phaseolus angularis TaxID=3914 RepID=A0A0L9UDH7_PHAAN|nr:hypothetical protein LR48_Vigan04g101100 [Vigna angularis]